jgi:hypothetical protein
MQAVVIPFLPVEGKYTGIEGTCFPYRAIGIICSSNIVELLGVPQLRPLPPLQQAC